MSFLDTVIARENAARAVQPSSSVPVTAVPAEPSFDRVPLDQLTGITLKCINELFLRPTQAEADNYLLSDWKGNGTYSPLWIDSGKQLDAVTARVVTASGKKVHRLAVQCAIFRLVENEELISIRSRQGSPVENDLGQRKSQSEKLIPSKLWDETVVAKWRKNPTTVRALTNAWVKFRQRRFDQNRQFAG
jgi:hypothetical protein